MRLIGSVVLSLLLLGATARAHDDDGAFREGRWYGGPIEDGDLSLCMMTAHFETGGAVFVMLTTGKLLAIGFERKGWAFEEDSTPALRLQLDGRPVATVGLQADSETVLMGIAEGIAFSLRMGAGSTLKIVGAGDPISFNVKGSARALAQLDRCVRKAASSAPEDAGATRRGPSRNDPFALPQPKLLEQLRR
jgi:hypothetical protein